MHSHYCTSGRAVQENVWFEAGSIGLTKSERANAEVENQIFSCIAQSKEVLSKAEYVKYLAECKK